MKTSFASAVVSLLLLLVAEPSNAQILFRHKVSTCHDIKFCFDCGSERASFREDKFDRMLDDIMRVKDMNEVTDVLAFQIVIDSVGNGCVLSYDALTSPRLVAEIIRRLNTFTGWIPAKGGTPKASSILFRLRLSKGSGMAYIERPDDQNVLVRTYYTGKPKIANRNYDYKNTTGSYDIVPFTVTNAGMPHNMIESVCVDAHGVVWTGTYNGLVALQDSTLQLFDSTNSTFVKDGNRFIIEEAAVSSDNVKWFEAGNEVHIYNDTVWRTYDTTTLRVGRIYNVASDNRNNVFIAGRNGVLVANATSFKFLDPLKFGLTSKQVVYANRDRYKRIWVGTPAGSAMMDSTGKMTSFRMSATPLSEGCITATTEDNDGNVWLVVHDLRNNDGDALVKLNSNGTWQTFTIENSGLPNKTITALLFDEKENVLWLGVEDAGLVRFDGNNNWQIYTNENSNMLSTAVNSLAQDNDGNIWCATLYGLVRVSKK